MARITNKTDTAPDVRLLTTISYPSRKVTESAWVRGRDLVFMKALQKFLFPVKRISTVKGEKKNMYCTLEWPEDSSYLRDFKSLFWGIFLKVSKFILKIM